MYQSFEQFVLDTKGSSVVAQIYVDCNDVFLDIVKEGKKRRFRVVGNYVRQEGAPALIPNT
jgi:hypothetical protein